MKKTLLSITILLAAGSANACNNDIDCSESIKEVINVINTPMQPIQPTDDFSKWGESYNAWFSRVHNVAESRLGIELNSYGDIAHFLIDNHPATPDDNSGDKNSDGNNDSNNDGNNDGSQNSLNYITPAQAQAGDQITMTYADAVSDHAEAAAEGYTDNAVADVTEEANAHADQAAADAEKHANTHADNAASAAEAHAKTYTNKAKGEAVKEADDYAEQLANSAVDYSTHYTDRAVSQAGAEAVKSANTYTDHVAKGLQKQITDNKRAIKRLGASSQATGNLHYNANRNGYALAVGEYNGETALAGGVQFTSGKHTAVTVQTSYDAEAFGGSVGLHGDW